MLTSSWTQTGAASNLGRFKAINAGVEPGEDCPLWGEALAGEYDADEHVMTVQVPVDSADTPEDEQSVFVVMSGSSGAQGTYAATPLTVAGSWDVGLNSGSFQYGYPLPSASVMSGGVPELSLNYSSASVDGLTSGDHAQVSGVGIGWSLTEAYVEQLYTSCGRVTWMTSSQDLCWEGEHYRIVLNGQSSTLVRDADATTDAPSGVTVFRLQNDPNWRVERRSYGSSTNNGDREGEYWQVYDTAGTVHTLGRGFVQRSGQPREDTNSVWTVPVFGDDPGDPCYSSVLENGWCTQAWRWNLDRVEDLHGNVIDYFYGLETNQYRRMGTTNTSYVRGGYLTRIDYGTRISGSTQQAPTSRTVLAWDDRCTQRATGNVAPTESCPAFTKANATSYPDVPMDLLCTSGTCTERGPSFFSGKVLRSTTSQVWNGSQFVNVDRVSMGHLFPAHSDGTSPHLLMRRLQQSGWDDAASSGFLPEVSFSHSQLANRVDHNASAGVPRLNKFRLTRIVDELGADARVTYGHPTGQECTAPWPTQFDTNTRDCFPRYWVPEFGPAGFGLFHKYVTLEVAVDNALPGGGRAWISGSADAITRYSYVGGAAWAHDGQPTQLVPVAAQSYSDWRGYMEVHVSQMADTSYRGWVDSQPLAVTQYRFFRGMYGQPIIGGGTRTDSIPGFISGNTNDQAYLAGTMRESRTMKLYSSGVVNYELTGTLDSYTIGRRVKANPTGSNDNLRDAILVVQATARERFREELTGGVVNTREARIDWTYDDWGRPVTESQTGYQLASWCKETYYAGDAAARRANKLDYISVVYERNATCGTTSPVVGRVVNYYDGSSTANNAPLIRGLLTTNVTRLGRVC